MSEYFNVVPWFNKEEWIEAYNNLFSEKSSLTEKESALNVLLVWKARCPALPSGIESTLCLLEVYIQDTKNFGNVTIQVLCLAYSSALMRFVNHMLDGEVAKGTSLYQAAQNLDVPDWIIDLRHNTAHNNSLPSIELLREACSFSLHWLKKHYWDTYKEHIGDYITGQDNPNIIEDNRIQQLLDLCISLSFCAHSTCKIKHLAAIPDPLMRESVVNDALVLFRNKVDLSNLKAVTIFKLISIMHIHSSRILKGKDVINSVNKILLGDDSLILSLGVINSMSAHNFHKRKKLSRDYVQCFEVLLTFLHINNLIEHFVLGLVKMTQCDDVDPSKCLLAALWVSEILKALKKSHKFNIKLNESNSNPCKGKTREELKMLFHHWFPNENSALLLDFQKPIPKALTDIEIIQPIVSTYNSYLVYFIKDLLDLLEPQLPDAIAHQICQLAKLISTPDDVPIMGREIYTVDDLKLSIDTENITETEEVSMEDSDCQVLDIPFEEDKCFDETILPNSIWTLSSAAHNWSACPIGQVPWASHAIE